MGFRIACDHDKNEFEVELEDMGNGEVSLLVNGYYILTLANRRITLSSHVDSNVGFDFDPDCLDDRVLVFDGAGSRLVPETKDSKTSKKPRS